MRNITVSLSYSENKQLQNICSNKLNICGVFIQLSYRVEVNFSQNIVLFIPTDIKDYLRKLIITFCFYYK